MKIYVINGPNLNLLGTREPEIYGNTTLDAINKELAKSSDTCEFEFFQSNHEGEIIDKLHEARNCTGIVLNAGAFTHYSYAIRDAVAAISAPVIEVHLSNVYEREDFRHKSVLSAVCKGVISGLGIYSYVFAIQDLLLNEAK